MFQDKNFFVAVLGENKFEILQLIMYGWLKRMKILVCPPGILASISSRLKHLFFIRKYVNQSIRMHKSDPGIHKGVAYQIHQETIDLTLSFFEQNIKSNNKIIVYYNNIFNTNKFEAYIKKAVSSQIFAVLNDLHFIRLFNMREREVLMIKNPVSRFVVAYMESNYKLKYRIRWVRPLWGWVSLFGYYVWLFKEFIKRGIVFNRTKKEYRLSKEAVWGFSSKTLRDDILIDNNKFKKDDILLLRFVKEEPGRARAFKEAKEKGFDTASIPDLKININKNIYWFLYFYIMIPVKVYLQLLFRQQSYFFYYIFLFHRQCFPLEILMNNYKIKCYISTKEWGGVEETIILNKYGEREVVFHWSDLSSFKGYCHAFTAHNIFFTWGDIVVNGCNVDNSSIDKRINIGCIYKKNYNLVIKNKERLIDEIGSVKKTSKTVAFFDTSIDSFDQFTERFFMEYMNIVREFCEKNHKINILLKPKGSQEDVLAKLRGDGASYKKILQELATYENFVYLDRIRWSAEEVIAISDVCINMGMNSPATIALICGKNALYFDSTGNDYHPFAKKYKNRIVFEDKEGLFNQIDNILEGRFDCREVISEQEIRGYDAFDDDNALERLRDNLYQLTQS